MRSEILKWPLKVLAGLVLWELFTRLFEMPEYLLPAPSLVMADLVTSAPILLKHAAVTGLESVAGLAVGIAAGFGLGVAIHSSALFRDHVYPAIVWLQSVPKMALAPLFVLWFGFGPASKIILVSMIVMFPVIVNTVKGLSRAPADALDLCRILRFSRWRVLREVEVPFSLPFVFAGIKVSSTLAVIAALVGEYLGADAGLGYLLESARVALDTRRMFGVIIVLGLLGVALFRSIELLERKILPWHLKSQAGE